MTQPTTSRINRNPLGIRKLDVQRERREFRSQEAKRRALVYLSAFGIEADENLIRCITCAIAKGWEDGVQVGAAATRERVAEALANGTLVKP